MSASVRRGAAALLDRFETALLLCLLPACEVLGWLPAGEVLADPDPTKSAAPPPGEPAPDPVSGLTTATTVDVVLDGISDPPWSRVVDGAGALVRRPRDSDTVAETDRLGGGCMVRRPNDTGNPLGPDAVAEAETDSDALIVAESLSVTVGCTIGP